MALLLMIRMIIIQTILCILLPFFYIYKFLMFFYRYFSSEDIKGKVVLITGASSGIGEHLTYEYAKRGACLVIVARRENLLKEVAEKARKLGSPDVVPICADVLKVDDCKRFVEEAVNHFGKCKYFHHQLLQEVYRILKRSKGSIFVNASSAARLSPPGLSIYAASKAALVTFYETMRVELAPEISVTIATLGPEQLYNSASGE